MAEPTLTALDQALGNTMEGELQQFEGGKIPPSPGEIKDESRMSTDSSKSEDQQDSPTDKRTTTPTESKISAFSKILGETSEIQKLLGDEKKEEVKKDDEDEEEDDEEVDQVKAEREQAEAEEEDYRKDPEDKGKPQRNLEGFGEREAKWLKRMPFEAYEHFSKLVKDSRAKEEAFKAEKTTLEKKVKDLSQGLVEVPESYYSNPEAVVLSPEYKDLQGNINLSQEIENHWKIQLERIENGQEWYDLVQDQKTGEVFVKKEAAEPTAAAKITVMGYYQRVSGQTQRLIGKLDSIVDSFKTRAESYTAKIRDAEKTYLPVFEDDKGEEFKLFQTVSGEFKKIGVDTTNPLFNMLAKSTALNLILRDILVKQVKGGNGAPDPKDKIKEDNKKAGPTAKQTTGGSTSSGNKNAATLKDFEKMGLERI